MTSVTLAPPKATRNTPLQGVIERAQSHDEAAYRELYERYQRPLRRLVSSRLGLELGQHLEAEDVVQETFLAAFQALERHEFRSEPAFFGWLARIAGRKLQDAIRYYRREKRTPRQDYFAGESGPSPVRSTSMAGSEPATEPEDMLESLERRELGNLAARCLRHLAPEMRAVVVWRDMHDEPWHRIAERLGRRTVGAARHLHGVACGELARHVKQQLAVGAL